MARKQWNVRFPDDDWTAFDARRRGSGLSRDEWTLRALRHLLATTSPSTPSASTSEAPEPKIAST